MHSLVLEKYLVPITLTWTQMPKHCKKTPDVYQFQYELKRKINELETMSVIAQVMKPAPWIRNMVVLRKLTKLGLCLDLLHLNKGIIRHHYPTQTVEDIAPKLTKAKVVSVVDAQDVFLLHVVLDKPPSYLTTFWASFARYRWLRIGSPESIAVIHDDIFMFGSGDSI